MKVHEGYMRWLLWHYSPRTLVALKDALYLSDTFLSAAKLLGDVEAKHLSSRGLNFIKGLIPRCTHGSFCDNIQAPFECEVPLLFFGLLFSHHPRLPFVDLPDRKSFARYPDRVRLPGVARR